MKPANKFRRNQLILAIIFITIGISGAWGMVEIAYQPYEYTISITDMSSEPELFGPKKPEFKFNYDFERRFKYDPDKETINC